MLQGEATFEQFENTQKMFAVQYGVGYRPFKIHLSRIYDAIYLKIILTKIMENELVLIVLFQYRFMLGKWFQFQGVGTVVEIYS